MATDRVPAAGSGYFSLVNQLRAIAALLVLWDHLVGQWLAQRGLTWGPETAVDRFVIGPLNLIQHAGFLGVALFFLISGFVVTRAGWLEPGWSFVVRRVLRIYPPLIAAVGLAILVAYALHRAGLGSDAWNQLSLDAIIKAMTLATYVTTPQIVVVGVAWSLIIEIIFYALVLAVAPILKSSAPDLLAPVAILTVVVVVGLLERSFGPGFFLFAVSVSYVPILVLGQIVFLVTQRGMSVPVGFAAAVLAWCVLVWGLERTQPVFLTAEGSYGSSLSVALAVFVAAVVAEDRIRPARWLDVVAARSYSIYLTHGIVGLFVLDLLWSRGTAYRWALVVALLGVAVATELMYRGVERPSIALARRLTRTRAPRPAAERDQLAEPDVSALPAAVPEPAEPVRSRD